MKQDNALQVYYMEKMQEKWSMIIHAVPGNVKLR